MSEYDKARDRVEEIHSRALILANEVDRLECERDEARGLSALLASALRVTTSRIQMFPKHQRDSGDEDAIDYAIEALTKYGGEDDNE